MTLLNSLQNFTVNNHNADRQSGIAQEKGHNQSSQPMPLCAPVRWLIYGLGSWFGEIDSLSKVMCFSWTILKGACLTQDNLSRRKIQVVNRYHMCQSSLESTPHLFIHCPVAADIWYTSLTLSRQQCAMPCKVKRILWWCLKKVEKAVKKIWNMVPACIFWCFDLKETTVVLMVFQLLLVLRKADV